MAFASHSDVIKENFVLVEEAKTSKKKPKEAFILILCLKIQIYKQKLK